MYIIIYSYNVYIDKTQRRETKEYLYSQLRLQHALRQLDRQEEKAKNKPQKPKKEKFTAMHVSIER